MRLVEPSEDSPCRQGRTRSPDDATVHEYHRVDEYAEPQPDVALIRARDYRESLPAPANVLLLIEVSDTTLAYDRGTKPSLYARAGIPEVCIVDLIGGRIEHHTVPTGDLYRHVELAGRGETLESVGLAGMNLRVVDVLG